MSNYLKHLSLSVRVHREPLTPFDSAMDELTSKIEALVSMNFPSRSEGTFIYSLKGVTEETISSAARRGNVRYEKSTRFSDEQLGVLVKTSMPGKYLINRLMQYPIIIDTPIKFTKGNKANLRVIGPDELVHDIYEDFGNTKYIQFGTFGSYQPDIKLPSNILTKRQREILYAAIRGGYYDVPRAIDHHDLSDKFGVAPQTIGEHLRRSEAKLINYGALDCEGITSPSYQSSRVGQRSKS